jgi:hypothetical protein
MMLMQFRRYGAWIFSTEHSKKTGCRKCLKRMVTRARFEPATPGFGDIFRILVSLCSYWEFRKFHVGRVHHRCSCVSSDDVASASRPTDAEIEPTAMRMEAKASRTFLVFDWSGDIVAIPPLPYEVITASPGSAES